MVKVDGVLVDIAPAVRGFTRYSSETRANMKASHRLGWRQRERIGELYWTHELCPGICFETKPAAYRAALRNLSPEPSHA